MGCFFQKPKSRPRTTSKGCKSFRGNNALPLLKGLEGFPEVTVVSKMEKEEMNFGGIWHSDTVYLETPPMASLLYSVEVPEPGGDTLFANQALAYESLSETMKNLLCGLTAINIAGKPADMKTRSERIEDSELTSGKSSQTILP